MLRPMPSLSLITNVPLSPETESVLSGSLSKTLAAGLGKPEAYVAISIAVCSMRFAGTEDPAVLGDIRSIGLPHDLNPVAEALTEVVAAECGVPAGRIYLTFADVPPARWAHGGSTFA